MKVSELTGPALDWAVMKCEYPNNSVAFFNELRALHPLHASFYYSTNWAQAGPIIEREKIEVRLFADDGSIWFAHLGAQPFPLDAQVTGNTPLIATMRCYVASKLGDDIEVPSELK